MLDFPDTPSLYSTYTSAGMSWTWDGSKWEATGVSAVAGGPFLPLAGGTMAGMIVLYPTWPSLDLHAASKVYVDQAILAITAGVTYLPITGGNLTGPISVAGSVTTTGSNAIFVFQDRTGTNPWGWYASGNIARLWSGSVGDRTTIDNSGNLVTTGDVTGNNLNLRNNYVTFIGNVGGTVGPYLYADASNVIARIGVNNGGFFVQDSAGNNRYSFNQSGLAQAGAYHYFAGGSGAVNSFGGPFIYSDASNTVLHLGTGNQAVLFQDTSGVNRHTFSSAGAATHGGSLRTGSDVFVGGSNLYLSGAGAGAPGPRVASDNNNMWFQLSNTSGNWFFYDSAGNNRFQLDAGGNVYTGSLRIWGGGDWGVSTGQGSFTSRYWRFQVNPGDEGSAGSISYRTFDGGALCIVGAGTAGGNRAIHLWDNVIVDRNLSVLGSLNISGSVNPILPALGAGAGNEVMGQRLLTTTANQDAIEFLWHRTANDNGWGTADFYIRRNVDNSNAQTSIIFGGQPYFQVLNQGGWRISIDTVNQSYRLPSGNGGFYWYEQGGGQVMLLDRNGSITIRGEISSSTGSLHAPGHLYLGGQYLCLNGSGGGGPHYYGDGTNLIARLGSGNGAFYMQDTGGTSRSWLDSAGTLVTTGTGNSGQLRMSPFTSGTQYGSFWRNDGSSTYLLLTNNNDAFGTWNGLRPFTVNNSNGNVSMSNGLWVNNSNSSQGVWVQNANGDALHIYDDGAPHLETTGNTLYINYLTGAATYMGGSLNVSDFYSRQNLNCAGDIYHAGAFVYFANASGGWNGGPLVYGDGNWLIVKCGGGNAGFEARNWNNSRIFHADGGGNIDWPGSSSCGGNISASGSLYVWDVHAGSGVFVNGLLVVNNGGWLWTGAPFHTDSTIQASGDVQVGGSLYVGGLQAYNNGGWFFFANGLQANALYSRGDIWNAGNIISGNNLYVNGSILQCNNINCNNDVASNGVFRCSTLAYGGPRGARVENWSGSGWDSMSFAIGGGYFQVSPDRGQSGIYLNWDNSWSDARLKTNIRDSEIDALGALCAVPVRAFEWGELGRRLLPHRADHPVVCGLVAQELEEAIPYAVEVLSLAGQIISDDGLRQINHTHLTAYFIRSIQQLTERIATLEARLS